MWSDDWDVAIPTFLAGMGVLLWPLFIFQCILPLPRQKKETRTCGGFLSSWVVLSIASACLWHFVGREPQVLWNMVDENRPHEPLQPWTAAWRMPPTTSLFVPSDENELRDRLLHDAPRPVRVVGSGHSWSATAHTPGTVIDIRHLNRVKVLQFNNSSSSSSSSSQETLLSLQERAGTITVQAGMKVQDAVQYLFARNLCLFGVGSIRDQAIGGAVSHGVHGPHPDGFNRHVVGLRVLLANGTFWEIDREEDLFMWRASIGLLGAIVEVTLEVFPMVRLQLSREPIRDFSYLDALDMFGTATFTAFLYPSQCTGHVGHARIGRVVSVGLESTGYELQNQSEFGSRMMLYFNDNLHPAMQYVWPRLGTLVSCLEQVLASWGHSTMLSGASEDVLPNDGLIPRFFEIMDYEYMVPLRMCRTFAEELMGGRFGQVFIPVCLRLVRGERSCLAMAYEDSCVFGLEMMRGVANLRIDVLAIERRVGELGGTAHLGKTSVGNFRHYHYPCLSRFREYREKMDPRGVFLTPFLAEAFRLSRERAGWDSSLGEFPPPAEARAGAHKRADCFAVLFWLMLCLVGAGGHWVWAWLWTPRPFQNNYCDYYDDSQPALYLALQPLSP